MSTFTESLSTFNDVATLQGGAGGALTNDFAEVGSNGALGSGFYLHFPNVTLPAGATITSATITLTTHESGSARSSLDAKVQIDLAANPSRPTSANWFSGHPHTSGSGTNWTIPSIAGGAPDTAVNTPDQSDLVQEVINLGGWASGNNMNFFIEWGGSTVVLRQFDATDAGKSPMLTINYTTPGGGSGSAAFLMFV